MLNFYSYYRLYCSVRTVDQKFAAVKKATRAQRRNASALQAVSSMEVAQIAGEGGFIGGVAGVMVGITLLVRVFTFSFSLILFEFGLHHAFFTVCG